MLKYNVNIGLNGPDKCFREYSKREREDRDERKKKWGGEQDRRRIHLMINTWMEWLTQALVSLLNWDLSEFSIMLMPDDCLYSIRKAILSVTDWQHNLNSQGQSLPLSLLGFVLYSLFRLSAPNSFGFGFSRQLFLTKKKKKKKSLSFKSLYSTRAESNDQQTASVTRGTWRSGRQQMEKKNSHMQTHMRI